MPFSSGQNPALKLLLRADLADPILSIFLKASVGKVTDDDDSFVRGDLDNVAREYLCPHLDFSIGYNEDQIVGVRISTDVRVLGLILFTIKCNIFYETLNGLLTPHMCVPSLFPSSKVIAKS